LALVSGKRPAPAQADLARLPGDCPPPATLDALAAAEWRRLVADLAGRLSVVDVDLLVAYVTTLTKWRSAEVQVGEFGMICRSPSGLPATNPYLAVAAGLLRQLVALGDRLGLSPQARGEGKR
jgi:P27 family predicted phage terminase small subunit